MIFWKKGTIVVWILSYRKVPQKSNISFSICLHGYYDQLLNPEQFYDTACAAAPAVAVLSQLRVQ